MMISIQESMKNRNINDYLIVFSSCKVVTGYTNSIIIDYERNKYYAIPNFLAEFINQIDGIKLSDLHSQYKDKEKQIVEEYLDFLFNIEVIFTSPLDKRYFPPIRDSFEYPTKINNIIWEGLDRYSFGDITRILTINKKNFSGYLEIISYNTLDEDFINELIRIFEVNTLLMGISFVIPYTEKFKDFTVVSELFSKFHRLCTFTLYNCYTNKIYCIEGENGKSIILTKKHIKSSIHCGIVHSNLFSNTALHIRESQHHNSCLNRKISIDTEGNIKNCPSMSQSFGNIRDTTLEEAINHPDFKKY